MNEKQTFTYSGQNSELGLVLILHLHKLCATGGKSNLGDLMVNSTFKMCQQCHFLKSTYITL